MAPPMMMKVGEPNVNDALDSISGGTLKERGAGLDNLIFLLDKKGKVPPVSNLADKHYHRMFESLFRAAIAEKQSYYGGKRTTTAAAASRLYKCAEALRLAVNHGASRLKRKTTLALIDHITQTLPGPDDGFVEPLLKDYVKSLVSLLAHQPNGEQLATLGAEGWITCLDFCTDAIGCYLENVDRDPASGGVGSGGSCRASPAPSMGFSTARSTNPSQRIAGQVPRGTVQDLLHCIHLLLSPPNTSEMLRDRTEISALLIQVLQLRHLGLSQVMQLAFASVNILLPSLDVTRASSLARDLVPLISHWWQARTVSQDEMLNSVRDEMLKTIFLIHLHLERLVCSGESDAEQNDYIHKTIEDLSEVLWTEYSRRDPRSQLQLDDLTFITHRLPRDYFALDSFGLRVHNRAGERRWALVQNLALLERILWKGRKDQPSQSPEEQPRKKRKTQGSATRLVEKLQSPSPVVQRTSLQLVPFLMHLGTLTLAEASELLPILTPFMSNKDATISSWAMLALASCAPRQVEHVGNTTVWKHAWQVTVRAVGLPSTSRAACVLLHTILEANLVSYHDISDEVSSIVTTADVNGPALLVDSSIVLMLHLLFLRNVKLPNASQATCHHIIRWVFLRWNPADLGFASLYSVHVPVSELVNLIRACCGAGPLPDSPTEPVAGGPICQTWKSQYQTSELTRYLLLLNAPIARTSMTSACCQASVSSELVKVSDSATFHAAKKLVLELMSPKVVELQELCDTWTKKGPDVVLPMSPDRLHSLFSAMVVGTMLVSQFPELNSGQSRDIESALTRLSEKSLSASVDSHESHIFFDVILRILRPVLPPLDTASLNALLRDNPALLKLVATVAGSIHERTKRQSAGQHQDLMDLDDDFDSQESKASITTKATCIPRLVIPMSLDSAAFDLDTTQRIYLLESVYQDSEQIGLVPQVFLGQLLSLSQDEFLMCSTLSSELFKSDLVIGPDDAMRVVEKLGEIVGDVEYTCCEVAHSTALSILEGLMRIWVDDKNEVSVFGGDLYRHFIKALPKNSLAPRSQIALSSLLLALLQNNSQYGSNLGLPSCRTILLSIMQEGTLVVKHFIGAALPDIFGIYVLKRHDDIFLDVLNSLPTDPEAIEGIAFRLFVLSQLACRWPTLLRRCTYHIFETPGKIMQSTKYAKRCLQAVSDAMELTSPKELFSIFSPQLLFTWLELDAMEDIPFDIFGFASLDSLLREAQAEVAALEIMRGRYDSVRALSERLGTPLAEMVRQGFTKVMAYTIANETSISSEGDGGDAWVRKLLGGEPYLDLIYLHFADIVALLFDLFDQEDPIEKYLARENNFPHAAGNLEEMKRLSQSSTMLPPNQQPMFRAKALGKELFRLCSKTQHELDALWTPALVVAVVRKLLNTVHPALGSLHACSVLRKVRVVIAVAGPVALEGYPLEMLLSSIRPFIVDSECADDALGVSEYLITKGSGHLLRTPSFLAGYALSTLASLRIFLESSQSSTTQESQFKATMCKAQRFHSWFSTYLASYDSPNLTDEHQRQAFRSITQSASHIRASGNAEKHTHESTLLLEILKDGEQEEKLLNGAARDLALGMLCGDFVVPSTGRQDVIDDDDEALRHSGLVWKSCNALSLSDEYLAWAGRVVGRSFAASGEIQPELLEESELSRYRRLAPGAHGSEQGLLNLLQQLTQSKDSAVAGLAESVLRAIVSEAAAQEDDALLAAAQRTLTESLCVASAWGQYQTPPSDYILPPIIPDSQVYFRDTVETTEWIQQLAVHLAQSVPDYILSALVPILKRVKGFAQDSFPFIVHLTLCSQIDKQQIVRRSLSEATKDWLKLDSIDKAVRANQKHLINTILYLRTQKLPKESSIADRVQWLDVDFSAAAVAASRCGMYKTALLFTEVAASQTTRVSRRSSAARDEDPTDVLLSIFENIDDPDAYYGLPQSPDLTSVLARLEYEKDGSKNLAFRGAQYDSHIRMGDPASQVDSQSLVRALGNFGLAGLSHSLLQTQQSHDGDEASLESTFQTARRLEIWNLPAPTVADNFSVTIYKAYQNIQQATDTLAVRSAIYDGFSQTMRNLINRGLNASKLRQHLGALAVLTELDDVVNVADFSELESLLSRFEQRGQWMRRGRYEDVGHLLSCRETTLRLMSQQPNLRSHAGLSTAEARRVEIRCMLMSSGIYRFHQATQESLNLSTSLTHLIDPCESLGLKVDAAVRIEAADSLWDHGQMIYSIRMLQSIDNDSSLKKQSIPISRSDLLSKIGHQVSVARLEKPHDIQKNYLEPALRELKGKSQGQQAGRVFHQFAMFCDEQLQNQDSLEDLARLQSLRQGKSDEVAQLQSIISSTRDVQSKQRYQSHLSRAKQWLQLDEQELRRVEQTRSEFVRLSVENYLLSLIASDEHNNDALRFTALWLERSDEDATNDAVKKHIDKVPTRKFAALMNQLSSRLQDQPNVFQKLLITLVYNICVDHPYHGMYQIWSGTKVKTRKEDQVAVLRLKATEKVAGLLQSNKAVATIWQAVDRTSSYYHRLAVDRDNNKYKAGQKIALKDVHTAQSLVNALIKYRIPPPTMQLEVSADKDYSKVPIIAKLDPQMSIASGVSAPKIITAVGSDGQRYRQLVKGGNDDLRQDAIMEQVFAAVSSLLKLHRSTQQRDLGIRTYKVLPLTSASGLIEFVPNTIPLHEFLMPAHERYFPKDLKGSQCRKEISSAQGKTTEHRISTYRKVTDRFHPVMKYFFMEHFVDPDDWFAKRLAYTRTTAAISMLGHVLGLGDRHGHNILLDHKTGEVVHIDLGVAFEMGRVLPVPELVPFRLTRDIVDGMGITGTEGVFRRCCEFTLHALREETYSIMTILDVLRYDPLYSWSISPVRLAKLQGDQDDGDAQDDDNQADARRSKKGAPGQVNEPSEADRALEVVRKKLSKTLSVTATVNDLINQATDISNLAVLYSGWAAYA